MRVNNVGEKLYSIEEMVNTQFMIENDPFLPVTHMKNQFLLGGICKSVKQRLHLHYFKDAKRKHLVQPHRTVDCILVGITSMSLKKYGIKQYLLMRTRFPPIKMGEQGFGD